MINNVKILVLFAVFFLSANGVRAQNPEKALEKWDEEVVEKANTAKNVQWLSEEEKKVYLFTNLARINGELFAETFLEEYLRDKSTTRYTRSLKKDLKKTSQLPLLIPQKDLYEVARGHARISGKRGTTGHQRFEKRFSPLMKKYNAVAENCAYGYNEAIDIVLGLLIDEGVKNLGHRENMLSPVYNSMGVAIDDHKRYRYNCVMDFGRKVK